jgi:hypothetical protein
MEELRRIFYDPKNGYPNINQLVQLAKDKKLGLTYEQVKEFYNSQQVNQIFKQNVKKKYEHIKAVYDEVGTLQADLMDVSKWARHNKGTNFLLNVVDIFSRYAWSYPLKSKSSLNGDIADLIDDIYKQIKQKYPNIQLVLEVDNGNEFKGKVKEVNEKYDVEVFLNNPSKLNQHTFMSIIERFNRTLLNKIKKHIYSQGSLNYIDSLQGFIKAYNNTEHSTINTKPKLIFEDFQRPIVHLTPTVKSDIDVGDYVRLVKKKKTFEKKSLTPNLSIEIYKVIDKVSNKFRIRNIKSSYPLQTLFIDRELVKIPDTTEIEDMDVIKSKIKQNDNLNKTVRDREKEKIGVVDKDTGNIEPENWRLKPEKPKRESKRPERFKS